MSSSPGRTGETKRRKFYAFPGSQSRTWSDIVRHLSTLVLFGGGAHSVLVSAIARLDLTTEQSVPPAKESVKGDNKRLTSPGSS